MSDELADYLASELGFARKAPTRAGLGAALDAFLGVHLQQRTPVQEQAIEVIYDGSDVVIVSATASGKTEAAMVPIAARLYSDTIPTLAVYIAPTRALLNDLYKRLEAPLHRLGLAARVRHGERRLPQKTDSLRVVFTTPESLDVLLARKAPLLERTRYAVLDEVHQIFGTPRGAQLAFLLERLETFAARSIQRIALSATVGDPDAVAAWIRPEGPASVIAVTGGRHIVADLHWSTGPATIRRLVEGSPHNKILCFVNSRRKSEDIYLALRGMPRLETYVHYSSLTRGQREFVERGFKTAQMAVCVATTTLELGIDIGSIQGVILADPPTTVSSFLQRVGRGGRRGDVTYVTMTPRSPLELLRFAAMLTVADSGQVEARTAGRPYSILVQQVFSILASKRRLCVHPDELPEQFSRFPWFTAAKAQSVLDHLVELGFLRRKPGERVYRVDTQLEDLIDAKEIHTNISGQDAGIPVYHSGRLLAHLPLRSSDIRFGNVVLFAGRFWRITGISDRGIAVELAGPEPDPARPVWGSRGAFATSSLLVRGMRELLLSRSDLVPHKLDAQCASSLRTLYDRTPSLQGVNESVWHEQLGRKHVYYTFAGATENQVLRLLFNELDMPCKTARGSEGVALISTEPLDFNRLPRDPEEVTATVVANWRRFSSWVSKGPFFEHLPANLRREEVAVQIATPAVVEHVTGRSGANLVPVDLHLVG